MNNLKEKVNRTIISCDKMESNINDSIHKSKAQNTRQSNKRTMINEEKQRNSCQERFIIKLYYTLSNLTIWQITNIILRRENPIQIQRKISRLWKKIIFFKDIFMPLLFKSFLFFFCWCFWICKYAKKINLCRPRHSP